MNSGFVISIDVNQIDSNPIGDQDVYSDTECCNDVVRDFFITSSSLYNQKMENLKGPFYGDSVLLYHCLQ